VLIECAQACVAAYDSNSLEVGNVEVLLSSVNGTLIVAFRGTELDEARDWLADAYALPWRPTALGGPWVHRGFYRGAKAAWQELRSFLLPRRGSIVLTGHSLGAAQATLTAALAVREGLDVSGLYLFASPHCGSKSLASLLSRVPAWHHFHSDDVVPNLPLLLGKVAWPHVGTQVALGNGGHAMKSILSSVSGLEARP
jgi:predicted lipase